MGSSIFVAMIRIKVASTTWAYLPIIPLAESTNREFLPLIVAMLPMLVLIDFPHCSKSLPIPYGFQVSASESTTWRQWFLPSGFPIVSILPCHPMFLELSLRDLTPPQIFCILSGSGFRRKCSWGKIIVWQGGQYSHISHCDAQGRYRRCCSWVRDAIKRSACHRQIYFWGWGGGG